jgi:hypothetical protein
MDTAPRLRAEDRPEFEKILNSVLRTEEIQGALRGLPTGLNSEQLRTRVLRAADTVATAAAAEYGVYLALQARASSGAAGYGSPEARGPVAGRQPSPGAAIRRADLAPLLAVLVPFLAGIAALLFLVLGYGLGAVGAGLAISGPLITAGLVAGAVSVAALAIGLAGLLVTALRGGSVARVGGSAQARLAEARKSWLHALRERAVLPYVREQLADHMQAAGGGAAEPSESTGGGGVNLVRGRPRLGYSRPAFAGPGPSGLTDENGDESRAPGTDAARFTSPGFTSYQGPPDSGTGQR